MLNGFWLLVNLLGILGIVAWYYRHISFGKWITLSIVGAFSLFVFISGILFWIEKFNMHLCLGICTAVEAAVILLLWFKRGWEYPQISFPKNMWIPTLICLLLLPVVIRQYGLYGMGQDQGVYPIKAIELMYGHTEQQKDFAEYQDLQDEEEKAFFRQTLIWLNGLDNCTELGPYPTLPVSDFLSDVSGIYHGIPTFPAMLALWGSIFGISNMAGFQILFWGFTVFLVYMITENLRLKKTVRIVVASLVAFSPIIIWTTKSYLTEPFLTVLLCLYVYFMTEKGNPLAEIFSAGVVVVFSYFHASAFTLIPMVVLVYVVSYINSGRIQSLLAGAVMVIGFGSGITMMAYVAPRYTFKNLGMSLYTILPFMKDENCLLIIWGAIFACLLLFLGLIKVPRERLKQWCIDKNIGRWAVRGVLGVFLVLFAVIAVRKIPEKSIADIVGHLDICSFAILSGVIVLPISYIMALLKPDCIIDKKSYIIMGILFAYCVLFYSVFLRPWINGYYYYSRYIAPFIPILLLWCGIVLNQFRWWMIYAIGGISICICIPFNYVLATQQDDTRMEWDVLTDLAEQIDTDDIVILDVDAMGILYLPLRAMTNAKIFPKYGTLSEQVAGLEPLGDRVLYISGEEGAVLDEYTLILKEQYRIQEYSGTGYSKWLPLPLEVTKESGNIQLYQCTFEERLVYDLTQKDFSVYGLGGLEGDFCWSNEETFYLECELQKKDYELIIGQATSLPSACLGDSGYEIKVFMNGALVGSVVINDTDVAHRTLTIPAEYVRDGRNVLSVQAPLWSASIVNPEDTRELGFPLQGVEFKAK